MYLVAQQTDCLKCNSSLHVNIMKTINAYMCFCLPIYLHTYPPTHPLAYLPTYLPGIHLLAYLPIWSSISLPTHPPTYLPTHPSTWLSIRLPTYLSTHLTIHLLAYLTTYFPEHTALERKKPNPNNFFHKLIVRNVCSFPETIFFNDELGACNMLRLFKTGIIIIIIIIILK
jgi:hypothetical protein